MTTKTLVKNFHTLSVNDNATESSGNNDQHFYQLRINVNGFALADLKVELVINNKKYKLANGPVTSTQKDKVQVKITAKKTIKGEGNVESTREFEKYYDILSQSNVDVSTMKYFSDPKNPLYLIVQFASNASENV